MLYRSVAFLLLLLFPAFNVACTGYGAPSEVINGTAVVTVESNNPPDFKQYTTFTITPTIQVQDDTSSIPGMYTRDASSIIPKIQDNMVSRGYTYRASMQGQTPPQVDLVIALYAYLGSQAYGGVYCNWYYWGYPYGCYPTWGYYGTYNYGTIVMQMGDYKNLPQPTPPGTQVALVWNGAVYGVLGTQQYNLQRVLTGIDQAFAQSPYISKQ
jgi:hypothetical protein